MVKRVLITGANKGIGRATVAAMLEADDDTFVFLGSRSKERGDAARAELAERESSWGERIEVVQLDVSSDASVSRAATVVSAAGGPLYGIVNNAGIGVGSEEMARVLDVNVRGPRRVCEAMLGMLEPGGRIVNISSASGPMFVAGCGEERRRELTSPDVTWSDIAALMEEATSIAAEGGDFEAAGLGDGSPYGFSKACLNAYTIALARENPALTINACTPGFIETDLTRPMAVARGVDPREVGMQPPSEGTRAPLHLLLGEPGGSGWYFGSDGQRSPLDRYRAPGDPPYTGA